MTMTRIALLLPLLVALTGCDQVDPYTRPGNWRPNGANDANLRAMVAVPADLAVATPASPADGNLAAVALARLRTDSVRSLPDSGLAEITPISGGSSAAPPTPATAAPTGNGP
jgi:hypothetical protein